MKITHDAWKCEICGHVWLAIGDNTPEKCAKCKSRKWNESGIDRVEIEKQAFSRAFPMLPPARMPIAAQIMPVEEYKELEVVLDEP